MLHFNLVVPELRGIHALRTAAQRGGPPMQPYHSLDVHSVDVTASTLYIHTCMYVA